MALTFTDGSTDVVDFGSDSSIDDVDAGTILAWVYPTTLTGDHGIVYKISAGYTGMGFKLAGDSNEIRLDINRATADLVMVSNTNQVVTDSWQFVGCRWDINGVATDQDLFWGDMSTVVAEVSAYKAGRAVGSGARTSDASNSLGVGNKVSAEGFTCWAGSIAWVGMWNVQLTDAEIAGIQYAPRITPGCVLFTHLGYGGATGTQQNWAALWNGTPTGTTLADHPAINVPFASIGGLRGRTGTAGHATVGPHAPIGARGRTGKTFAAAAAAGSENSYYYHAQQ